MSKSQSEFESFKQRIENELMTHRIITNNAYCNWFETATPSMNEVRHFIVQFSVFSNLFLIAQLKKMINAVDLEEMHQAKEILANEIGCIFNPKTKESVESRSHREENSEEFGDPDLVNTKGTVDGGTFKFAAAHFEWLLTMGEKINLTFSDMGKRRHGTKSTLFFCDELERIYANEDFTIAAGASYAVENWAAAGFWGQLVGGLKKFKKQSCTGLPLGFFTWHDKVEAQHAEHTQAELEELYFGEHDFDEEQFIAAGKEMLEGVAAFWDGLNEERLARLGSGTITNDETHAHMMN